MDCRLYILLDSIRPDHLKTLKVHLIKRGLLKKGNGSFKKYTC